MRILVFNEDMCKLFKKYDKVIGDSNFNIDKKIIEKINEYNPKLKIKGIIFEKISKVIEKIIKVDMGKYFGLILDLHNIEIKSEEQKSIIYNDQKYNYEIFGYIFMSGNKEDTRNALFAQKIFPGLIYILELSQKTENFEISNKPIYFINLIPSLITAKSIIQEIEMLKLAGIEFVNIFDNGLQNIDLSNSLDEFSNKYQGNSLDRVYEYNKDEYTLKLDKLKDGIKLKEGKNEFEGSSEKFYWIGALCLTKFAFTLKLNINIEAIYTFKEEYKNEIEKESLKFIRTVILFDYLEKLSKRKEYFNV